MTQPHLHVWRTDGSCAGCELNANALAARVGELAAREELLHELAMQRSRDRKVGAR